LIIKSDFSLKKRFFCSPFSDGKGRISSLKSLIFLIAILFFAESVFAQTDSEHQASPKEQIPLKVAILPVSIHSPENLTYMQEGLLDMLSSRVELSGRVVVLEKGAVKKALGQPESEIDSQSAKKLGQDLGADYVVFGSLTKLGDTASLDLKVVEVKGEKPAAPVFVEAKKMEEIIAGVDDLARKVDERILGYSLMTPSRAEKPAAASKETAALPILLPSGSPSKGPAKVEKAVEPPKEVAAVPAGSLPGFKPLSPAKIERSAMASGIWQSQPFPFHIKGMAVGDVDGDGRNEVVLIEERSLLIYRYEKGFKLLKKIEGNRLDNYLAVDVGDFRKDGRPQIFVTNLQVDRLSSFVVAYQNGHYQIIAKDLRWFLRVVDWEERGKVLLGQRKGNEAAWQGPIYELGWDGKGYKEIRQAGVPKGPSVYGFAPFTHEGKMAFIFIDSDFKMKAVDQRGKVTWRSKDTYGSDNVFQVKEVPTDVYTEGDEYVWVNVRMVSQGDEIVVIRNNSPIGQFFKRQKFYSGGEVQRLVWNGAMLLEDWKSQEIPGYLVDFQIQDIIGEQGKELIVAVNLPKESVLSFEKSSALMISRVQGIQ
jgi:TolB-like protein